jgi:hypothetical protein
MGNLLIKKNIQNICFGNRGNDDPINNVWYFGLPTSPTKYFRGSNFSGMIVILEVLFCDYNSIQFIYKPVKTKKGAHPLNDRVLKGKKEKWEENLYTEQKYVVFIMT